MPNNEEMTMPDDDRVEGSAKKMKGNL